MPKRGPNQSQDQIPVYKPDGKKAAYGMTQREANEAEAYDAERQAAAKERADEIDGTTAQLLDEIDTVLELNAEELVRSFVQKGGE